MEDDGVGNKELLVARSNKDVGKYVDMYQRMKNRTEVLAGKLMVNEILEKAWTYLTVDFIMKLLLVAGNDAILVVCNRLSKMAYFVATIEETTTERLARLFRDSMWKLHGLLKSVISNRGLQFVAELIKELNKMLEIESRLLTAFYPQMDEPKVGVILVVLHRTWIERLARVVSNSGVCSE